jgi:hypothetical protein
MEQTVLDCHKSDVTQRNHTGLQQGQIVYHLEHVTALLR